MRKKAKINRIDSPNTRIRRIGIDIDEVLVDFISPFSKYYNSKFNTQISEEHFVSYNLSQVFKTSQEKITLEVHEFTKSESFKKLPPLEGSIEAIEKLSEEYELFIITARSEEVSKTTLDWLKTHFKDKFKNVHFSHNPYITGPIRSTKTEIGRKLKIDLLIEDNLSFAIESAEAGIKVLMIDATWNQSDTLHRNITRVYSWNDILKRIAEFKHK